MPMKIECEISLGELVDKLSILYIKEKNLQDPAKLVHVKKEIGVLQDKLNSLNLAGMDSYLNRLVTINSSLWKIEDDIRDKERAKEFDNVFIELARSVYITNDQRFECKNEINAKYSSAIVEVKSYQQY
jgi:hypothetical protein